MALAALAAAGCGKIAAINQPVPRGAADFRTYVAMGTSISAGFESGGLVVHHQQHAFPDLFARQVGMADFTLPSISSDGIPPLLRIVSLSPLVVSSAGRTLGSPTNLLQAAPYDNLGVPGALLVDAADSSFYYSNPFGRPSTMFDLIVRHRGTLLAQAASLSPTFVTFEYGANEVLGPATSGSGSVTPSPAEFAGLLHLTLDGLRAAAPAAKVAIFNVPDVTSIPFVTTFPPLTVSATTGAPMPLLGTGGPLSSGDYVLLTAAESLAVGTGFAAGAYNYVNPVAGGNGRPLDDDQVLTASEAASVQSAVEGYNAAVAGEAAARGFALADLHGLLARASSTGLRFQGTTYTSAYVTGGLFSLDGVHPTDLAYGFVANLLIDAVNATFHARIPPVDLAEAATLTSSRMRPVGPDARLGPVIQDARRIYSRMFPSRSAPIP